MFWRTLYITNVDRGLKNFYFYLENCQQSRKKHKEGKKRKKKKLKMEKRLEEIALMEHFASSAGSESKPVNGHLKKSPVLRFTCPTPPEQRPSLQTNTEGNGSNLRRKISRSASHIAGFSQNFKEKGGNSDVNINLNMTQETRKISSSEGDMVGNRGASSPFVKQKHHANGKQISQSSIFENAFPSVPPLRQTSINPGQKVVQVSEILFSSFTRRIDLVVGSSQPYLTVQCSRFNCQLLIMLIF